ncbi:hypothetical protein [Butyrivibrio sp. AE3004]|uniref:hypothetical protein n=1 Tax=Butyrivibrio sp. AE3004 TaxID=1506994 RepID=UPI00068D20AC|nr:hypothetical protein [Butyrivibrio sp. AE3004]
MAAYFSIVSECSRDHIYADILQDFYKKLSSAGMQILSGYWQFMDMPMEEIIAINQKKLEDNYELGFDENADNDYIQVMYDFCSFSEVRLFIMNHPDEGIFTIHIIIPEDDLLTISDGRIIYDQKKINPLKDLSVKLWELPFVDIIQTSLELSDDIETKGKIKNGAPLAVEPFAIIPDVMNGAIPTNCNRVPVSHDGILVTLSNY